MASGLGLWVLGLGFWVYASRFIVRGSELQTGYCFYSWVAVKEPSLSYHIGETLLFTIYIYPLW